MTIRAMTPINISSLKLTSNISYLCTDMEWMEGVPRGPHAGCAQEDSGVFLFLGLHVDGFAGFHALRDGLGRVFGGGFLHAFLETLDGAAEIFADIAQLLGAEDEGDDDQDDQPMPDTETTHD